MAHPEAAKRMTFRGANAELINNKDRECVISAGAGSGKSVAALLKLWNTCERVPGVRCLLVRKTRASLTQSGMVTLEGLMGPTHPALAAGGSRRFREEYVFPNGSVIVVGGMDNAIKIMSTDYDLIFVQEAIELAEEDWEALSSRLRHNRLSYQQIYGDTNPGAPTHWLKRRADAGRMTMLYGRHEENPTLHDGTSWTPQGLEYLARLDALTGARYWRLRHGKWRGAEGVVYEGWDPGVHIRDPFVVPYEWPRYWSVDFGFVHPFVCLMAAVDPDGRLVVYREIYHTKRLVEDHARRMSQLLDAECAAWAARLGRDPEEFRPYLRPRKVVCDHDAEDRATLAKYLVTSTSPAKKAIKPGIEAVAARLRVQPDGKPRLVFLSDSLDEFDTQLDDAKRPTRSAAEFDGYVFNTAKDMPVKDDDHGCLVAGTLVETDAGPRPIETIRAGDMVLTRAGYCRVLAAGMTNPSAELTTVTFSDGSRLCGTPNHPVCVAGGRFVSMDSLRYDDTVVHVTESDSWKRRSWQSRCCPTSLPASSAFAGTVTRTAATRARVGRPGGILGGAGTFCIGTYGRTTTARFLMGTRFTTGTTILPTTTCRTSSVSPLRNTIGVTQRTTVAGARSVTRRGRTRVSARCTVLLLNGMAPRKVGSGTASMAGTCGPTGGQASRHATTAARSTRRRRSAALVSVPTTAGRRRAGSCEPITSRAPVPSAAARSTSTDTRRSGSARGGVRLMPGGGSRREPVPVARRSSSASLPVPSVSAPCRVRTLTVEMQKQAVFNLTVQGQSEFFANGVLVHNCDCVRYLVAELDLRAGWQSPSSSGPGLTERSQRTAFGPGDEPAPEAGPLRFGEGGMPSRRRHLFGA